MSKKHESESSINNELKNNEAKRSLRENIDSKIIDSLICTRAINILVNITHKKISYEKYVTLEDIVNKIKNIDSNTDCNSDCNSDIEEIISFMKNSNREKIKCNISVIGKKN
jgi:hypothetical protein